ISLFSVAGLIVIWKMKRIYINTTEVTIVNIIGKKQSYTLKQIKSIGHLSYVGTIELENGDSFIFQIPLNKLPFYFGRGLNTTDKYIAELTAYINKMEELRKHD
ncbi:MAG TPA: hypothetical protein VK174_06365, partial [Chitinophagales bacterium]|nr:hypothetical protein [Chitinophagales bacterium]